ncbi:MAG: hypothetical protein IJ525_03115 [Alphaproteobacteria bacterium]|nr:hypothetical protein [Alphaproteobacteria bacterium]
MVEIVYMDEYQDNYLDIKNWYIQQGVSEKSFKNIILDIENTIEIIMNNPNGFRILKTRPLHYATTLKYRFNIYYTVIQNAIILSDIKAPKQNRLYETINDEVNEILEIAGVNT